MLFDVTRPLGNFLAEFEHDPDREWKSIGMAPLRMYAAFRIWNGYLMTREYRKRDKACDRFMEKMSHFTMTFQQQSPLQFDSDIDRPESFHISSRISGSVPLEEIRLDLWYPDNRLPGRPVGRNAGCL